MAAVGAGDEGPAGDAQVPVLGGVTAEEIRAELEPTRGPLVS